MNLIAAVDRNWAIGKAGKLLAGIPGDMKNFRLRTTGKVIVAGRKTVATFPQGMALPDRKNFILSRNAGLEVRGAAVVTSVDELLAGLTVYKDEDVFVVGGESVYRQLLPYCDTAYITWIDHAYEADAHLENLDESPEWELADESEEQTCFDLEYVFREYRRVK